MGYYIEMIEGDAYIPSDRIQEACRGMEPMMQPDHVAKHGQGGSWSNGGRSEVWYSWVDDDKCRKLLAENDLAGFIEAWGFETYTDADGNIHLDNYNRKTGQEEYMLQNLAPFIAPNTYMKWRGEENEMWAFIFEDGKLVEKAAKVVWE